MTAPYKYFTFLYPPRPENAIMQQNIKNFTADRFLAQPKLNGSCATLYVSDMGAWQLWDRDKTPLPCFKLPFGRLAPPTGSGANVFAGEYLNKNKFGENGQRFNHKFVIWDLLVYCGEYLLGTTLEERLQLLREIIPCDDAVINNKGDLEMHEFICATCHEGIYQVNTYHGDFANLYQRVIPTDVYEGIVLKRRSAKLEHGYKPDNNRLWQVKCRKQTKLYNS